MYHFNDDDCCVLIQYHYISKSRLIVTTYFTIFHKIMRLTHPPRINELLLWVRVRAVTDISPPEGLWSALPSQTAGMKAYYWPFGNFLSMVNIYIFIICSS